MQANLLHEQLLDASEEVHRSCCSKSYLLGIALSTLELCGRDLAKAYDKKGLDSFDTRYLISPNGLRIVSSDERRLINDISGNSSDENLPSVYSGSTELFFLTSSLLRVSIFPSLRTQDEYSQKYRSVFSALRKMASEASDKTAPVQDLYKRCAAGLLGYETCSNDDTLMSSMVEFSILQLRFLADLSESSERSHEFALIPESLVKLSSQYIARVARSFQRRISPQQAEQAVTYAIILLGSKQPLSIQVQTELMRISGAFIGSNVQHEASIQRRKQRNGKSKDEDDDESAIDYRELDIYSTLNNKVHGAAVFASPVAAKQLGPNLVRTFIAMDAVEGIDVERENHMHKNQVQSEICELILRLWLHPSGDFKKSITSMSTETLETFVRSVSASICISVDFLYQTIMDVRDILEHQIGGQQVFGQTKTRLHRMYEHLPNSLSGMRRQLLLLCYLSRDDSIAKLLGDSSVSSDLAVMIISLLDKLTSSEGVTHPFVDFNKALKNASGQNTSGSDSVKDLIDARMFSRIELGFDVSIISHLLFAMASRWSLAAGKEKNAFISSLVTHHDFDLHHFFQIFQRLIVATSQCKAGDNASILKADGYVDSALWRNQYNSLSTIGLEESKRSRRHSSVQDQFTHTSIGSIATVDQIKSFVDALYSIKQQVDETKGSIVKNETDIINLERDIMKSENTIDEEGYTSNLEAWLVSSDSFTSETSDRMDHFYSSNAKSATSNLGKVLLKDARRAYKDLPKPHPNASIFVCYAEERMDIVRAVCVGPQGTPYAYGMFVFDICYPQLYPNAAPMVHFMTTGGGQVRFSPNLYNDGKVCLSLLGTTESWNEAQRWSPKESSLAQVLLSIQTQILDTSEPYYTEGGGHGGMESTTAGKKGSARYNNTLRLSTLRHAIIEPLKYPPKGFEDVVRRHFAMLRKRVLTQAKIWTLESEGTELASRFKRSYSELVGLLSSDTLACQEWEVEEVGGSTFGDLPPRSDDLQTLERLDQRQDSPFRLDTETEGEGEDNYNYDEEAFDDDGDADMLAIALEMSLNES